MRRIVWTRERKVGPEVMCHTSFGTSLEDRLGTISSLPLGHMGRLIREVALRTETKRHLERVDQLRTFFTIQRGAGLPRATDGGRRQGTQRIVKTWRYRHHACHRVIHSQRTRKTPWCASLRSDTPRHDRGSEHDISKAVLAGCVIGTSRQLQEGCHGTTPAASSLAIT